MATRRHHKTALVSSWGTVGLCVAAACAVCCAAWRAAGCLSWDRMVLMPAGTARLIRP